MGPPFHSLCKICGEYHTEGGPCITNTPRGAPTPRDPLLQERQKTHGSFADHANVTQNMKRTMERFDGGIKFNQLSDRHREALHMIVHKIGRIMAGKANFKDHWDDIAGYAKLGSEACDE